MREKSDPSNCPAMLLKPRIEAKILQKILRSQIQSELLLLLNGIEPQVAKKMKGRIKKVSGKIASEFVDRAEKIGDKDYLIKIAQNYIKNKKKETEVNKDLNLPEKPTIESATPVLLTQSEKQEETIKKSALFFFKEINPNDPNQQGQEAKRLPLETPKQQKSNLKN